MEISMFPGFTDMGMMNDLSFIHHQLQVNSSVEELFVPQMLPAFVTNYDHQLEPNQALSCKRSAAQVDLQKLEEKPLKQHKTNNNNNHWNNKSYETINNHNHVLMNSQDNSSTMLSFSNNSSSCSNQTNSGLINPEEEVAISNVSFPGNEMLVSASQQASSVDKHIEASPRAGCMTQQSKDHIIAERKRREKLSQKFIALSAIIPGLKKMDKASVLGDAIKYVKQLQERVTKLEDEAKKTTMESAVFVKRSYVSAHEDDQFSGQTIVPGDGAFPEIEARFSDKDVLIKIHCDKKKRVVDKIISTIEELNLVVSSSSSLAFGGLTLAVTIIAQMDVEFSMTAKDLVKHIHATLKCLT